MKKTIPFLRFQLHSFSIVCTTEFGEFCSTECNAIVLCLLAIFAYFNQIILCTIVRLAGKLELKLRSVFQPGPVFIQASPAGKFVDCYAKQNAARSRSYCLQKYNYLFQTDVQLKIVVIRSKHLTWLACTAAEKRAHSGFYSKLLICQHWMRAAFRARSLQDECDRCEIIYEQDLQFLLCKFRIE